MSSAGQIVGGIAGGVIGFFAGGPIGAVQGFAIGAGIGGYIDPPPGPNLKGPTLDDKTFQSSAYGVGLPELSGTIATMGNIIYLENNEYKAASKKESQGGKGGGGATVETTTYFATFAVSLGVASPGALIRRVWAGGKLFYSAGTVDLETILQSYNQNGSGAARFKFYDGTQTEPDSRMEAVLGVGNCPSYEGTMYIIFYDFDLTEYGNGLAGCPIKVEISSGGVSPQLVDSYETPYLDKLMGCSAIFYEDYMFYTTARLNPVSMPSALIYRGNVQSSAVEFLTITGPAFGDWFGRASTVVIKGVNTECQGWYSYYNGDLSDSDSYFFYAHGENFGTIRFLEGWFLQGIGKVCHTIYGLGFSYVRRDTFLDPDEFFVYSQGSYLSVLKNEFPAFCFSPSHLVTVDDGDNTAGVKPRAIKLHSLSGSSWVLDRSFNVNLPNIDFNYTLIYANNLLYIFDVADHNGVGYTAIDLDGESIVDDGYVTFDLPYFEPQGFKFTNETMWGNKGGLFGISWSLTANTAAGCSCIFAYFVIDAVNKGGFLLSDFADDVLESSGVDSYSTADLDGIIVDGYLIDGIMSSRAKFSPLQAAFIFDIVEAGYSVSCVRRDVIPVAEIPYEHLIFTGGKGAVSIDREQDSRLHSHYQISYIDFNREYDTSLQISEYPALQYSQRQEQIPVVMTADFAAQTADILHGLEWLERESFSFSLPQIYLFLNASDIVSVEVRPGAWRLMRIAATDKSTDQIISIQARAAAAGAYSSSAAGADVDPPSELIPLIGRSYSFLLDIPMILEQEQDTFGFVAATYSDGSAWPGSVLMSSADSGQTYSALSSFYGKATIANTETALAESDGLTIERDTSLTVSVLSGTLSSITETQMMTGLHYCAYGADGRWEIIQYANADLISDTVFELSIFARGMFGTEWATGLHQVGDLLILLDDPDNQFIGRPALAVGIENLYKPVTVGSAVADAIAVNFTYMGVNLRPLSVVNIEAERNIGNDLIVDFFARTRYSSSFWVTGTQPQNEPILQFEIDILNGISIVRTITASTNSFTYTEAEQIADFGSAQSSIDLIIYQISSRVGRGYPAEATL